MLHRCSSCRQLYLTSEFYKLCDLCGDLKQRQIEQLYEHDSAIEWVALLSLAHNPQQPEVKRRWEVR